jgi:hypothetical protein
MNKIAGQGRAGCAGKFTGQGRIKVAKIRAGQATGCENCLPCSPLTPTHPNIWLFIDSIRNEVQTVHDLILQINCGMRPHEKKINQKLLNNELKNYAIGSTIKELQSNLYYKNFLLMLHIKNKL